jgi:hypothetical protein
MYQPYTDASMLFGTVSKFVVIHALLSLVAGVPEVLDHGGFTATSGSRCWPPQEQIAACKVFGHGPDAGAASC